MLSPPAGVLSPPAGVLSPPAGVLSPPAGVLSPPPGVVLLTGVTVGPAYSTAVICFASSPAPPVTSVTFTVNVTSLTSSNTNSKLAVLSPNELSLPI